MSKQSNHSRQLRLLPLTTCLAIAIAQQASAVDAMRAGVRARSEQLPSSWNSLASHRARAHTLVKRKPSTPAVVIVTNCDDSGSGSLRDAIAGAASGDVIDLTQLTCSTITLTSGAITTALDDLEIHGPGRDALSVDGNSADRVLLHRGGGTLTLADLTLTHGRSVAAAGTNNYGGCVLSYYALTLHRARLSNCELISDATAQGGGAFAQGAATITDSEISANTVRGSTALGGGIFAYASLSVSGSTLTGNAAAAIANGYEAVASGGAALARGDLDLTDSTIDANSATAATSYAGYAAVANVAGALALGSISLTRTTVSNNAAHATNTAVDATGYAYAYSYGGGMRAQTLLISDSTISGNSTLATATNQDGIGIELSRGGGFTTLGSGNTPFVRISNSTISGNTVSVSAAASVPYAYSLGGGVFANGGTLDMKNSTIAFNSADVGGGIFQYAASSASADSTIVASNFFGLGHSDFDVGGAVTVVGANNLIASGAADLALPADTLSADPLLDALADNGGPTSTHALLPGSPAVDAGNNAAALEFDQRGIGFPRVVGALPDIGALETQPFGDAIFSNGFE